MTTDAFDTTTAARPARHQDFRVVRIEMSAAHRRQLGDMAIAAKVPVDTMAGRLLAALLDDNAAAHETPTAAPPLVRDSPCAESEPSAPFPAAASKREPVEYHGVHVDFSLSSVTYRGRRIDVSSRAADMVAVLAHVMPEWMTREEIAARAWPDLAPSSGYALTSGVSRGLLRRLLHVGLTIKKEHGLGLALQAEAPAP